MCIYPHSSGVLCLRAPIRLHHLCSSLQNNVHKRARCTFWLQPEEPSPPPRGICDLLLLPVPRTEQKFPFRHTLNSEHRDTVREQSSSGLNWDGRKVWDSQVQELSSKPWNPHLRLGEVLLLFSWTALGDVTAGNVRSLQDPAKRGFVFLVHKRLLRQAGIPTKRIKE